MDDTNYVTILEQYLISLQLYAEYELLPDERNAQGRSIRFQLTVGNKVVIGVGKTKKKAKENAAENMYNLLIEEEKKRAHKKSEEKKKDPIDALTELCSKFNLGLPKFDCESNMGSSHRTMYNVSCSVLGLTEEVKSFKKDRAKKQAASNMMLKLKEQEKVHDEYFHLLEEEKKTNFSFLNPDGSLNEDEKEKFIANVWRKQFVDNLKKSKTALEMKTKDESHLDDIEDPEGLFSRIMKEMDITYDISFHCEKQEWNCSIEILSLYFKMSMKDKDKKVAGKSAIRKVLKYMHKI